jgi:alcohol dehydrogenase class IV
MNDDVFEKILGLLHEFRIDPNVSRLAMRALEIDKTLAEAHTSLTLIESAYEWNWAEAEELFERAMG